MFSILLFFYFFYRFSDFKKNKEIKNKTEGNGLLLILVNYQKFEYVCYYAITSFCFNKKYV